MLHTARFLAFVLVVGYAAFGVSGLSFAQRAQGYVQEASGNVSAQVGATQPAKVEKGQTLVNNATITTAPQSYAVLKFEDGTAVLLKENTAFQIQNYSYNPKAPENANAIFNLVRGGLRMVTGLVTSRNRGALKVATPIATIGIRGTDFRAELVNPLYIALDAGADALVVANAAPTAAQLGVGQIMVVTNVTTPGTIVPITQVPAGVLQMPNYPLTPVPATIPPGAPVGGGAAAGSPGAAIAIGAAAVAGAIAASNNQSTAVHH